MSAPDVIISLLAIVLMAVPHSLTAVCRASQVVAHKGIAVLLNFMQKKINLNWLV
jgi:hypothetical protein